MSKRNVKSRKAENPKINKSALGMSSIDYPVFCFKHLKTNCSGKDYKFYFDFIERLSKISSLSWKEINLTHKHGFGTEKMPVGKIKPTLPPFVTPDVKDLIVFRANGDNRPFLGIRNENVFHIIFIEESFGDVYDHN